MEEVEKHFRFMIEAKTHFENKNFKKALELYNMQLEYLKEHKDLHLPNMEKILSMLDFCIKMTKAEVAKMDNLKMDEKFNLRMVKLAFRIGFGLNIFLASPDHPPEMENIIKLEISELLPIEKYEKIHALLKLLLISKNSKGFADLMEVDGMEGFMNTKKQIKEIMNSDTLKDMQNTMKTFFGVENKDLGKFKSKEEEEKSQEFSKSFLYMSHRVNLINEIRSKLTLDFPLAVQFAFKMGERFMIANKGGLIIHKFAEEDYLQEAHSYNYPEEFIDLLDQLENAKLEEQGRISQKIFNWFT